MSAVTTTQSPLPIFVHKNFSVIRFTFFLISPFLFFACASKRLNDCPHIVFQDEGISLTKNEKILICGVDKGTQGWESVPLPQAEYHLGVYLQRDGYLKPRFVREGDTLKVWKGPRTKIKTFSVEGERESLNSSRKRKVLGEALTSEKLDEIETWADATMRSEGYACPEQQLTAQSWDSRVVLKVQPGIRRRVGQITREGFDSLDDDTFDRYMAFELGEIYDVRKTQLTSSRLLADGLVQSANFKSSCRGEFVDLELKGSIGPPRIFRFEFGGSTEQFPFGSITFKNTRLDDKASSFTATLFASPRLQNLNVSSQLFVVPGSQRTFIGPRFNVARASERSYEYTEGKIGMDVGRYWDKWSTRFIGRFGPSLNYVKTLKGIGPEVGYLSFDGNLQGMSNAFEAGTSTQYQGWMAALNYQSQRKGVGSEINVDRYNVNYKYLWNIGKYSPPLFVLGSRFEINAVDSGRVNVNAGDDILPQEYRVFYGGGDNLRGFARKSLDNASLGYLTSAYAGFELRLVEQIRWNIQPLVLYDVAKLGSSRFSLDQPIFTSAGGGVRWPSPFGTIRGSAAKGRVFRSNSVTSSYKEEWVYFFSFGQEF